MKIKNKTSTSNLILFVIIITILIYTIAAFALQYFTGAEISPTLTEQFFRTFMVELIALSGIKITKVRSNYNNYTDEETFEDEIIEEGE